MAKKGRKGFGLVVVLAVFAVLSGCLDAAAGPDAGNTAAPKMSVVVDGNSVSGGSVVDLGDVSAASGGSMTVEVTNDGDDQLLVSSIEASDHPDHPGNNHKDQLSISGSFDAVDPGDTQTFLVSISPSTPVTTQNYAALRIATNDLDEGDFRLSVEFVTVS
jgi:hypothetical protein